MSGSTSSENTRISCPQSNASVELKLNLSDGSTLTLDLPTDLEVWDSLKVDPAFHARVRGMLINFRGHSYSLPVPKAFRRVSYDVEMLAMVSDGAEQNVPPTAFRASYVADSVTASMTLYLVSAPPMVRFDVRFSGKLRWRAP